MGILNVTPDSFSDGGRFCAVDEALAQAERMISAGAAIVDVGGESTRPGSREVEAEEERRRVVPVITEIAKAFPEVCISIDTSKPEVAMAAIEAGARIINDVTGFRDPRMIELAARERTGLVAMHMQGTPRTMQRAPTYGDVVEEIRAFFEDRHREMLAAGVDPESIVFDPGIGFGKTLDHNLELLRRLPDLSAADRPLLLGVSRKSFIGALVGSDEMSRRGSPTVAITCYAAEKGAPLHRVHEVEPNVRALRMTEAILAAG